MGMDYAGMNPSYTKLRTLLRWALEIWGGGEVGPGFGRGNWKCRGNGTGKTGVREWQREEESGEWRGEWRRCVIRWD